jgi:alpha-mannosidase
MPPEPRIKWPADLTPRTFWAEERLRQQLTELRRYVARDRLPIAPVRRHDGDLPPEAAAADFDDSAWPVIRAEERLAARADQLIWLRASVTVPAGMAGERLALRFGEGVARGGHNNQAESLLYLNGRPYHGLDGNHRVVFLPETLCRDGSTLSLAVQAWTGWSRFETLRWEDPELIWFDGETDALAYDLDALVRTLLITDRDSLARAEMVHLGEAALLALDWTEPGSERFYASVRAARAITTAGFERLKGQEGIKPTVAHVGHTHLDVAWLWTLDNIKLKTARSWASALRLLEQYPDFVWIQSQPQLYKYVKETQPELWAEVKRRVAEGRWEADGGMWVEADCNLSGGESLVRQFLYGMRFFREELGVRCTVLWLPDVFGYAWALPQIVRGCGLQAFMTTKISWSQFNRFPYDTFRWRGIDGTELLTHFVTTPGPDQPRENWYYTYNGQILPDTVKGNWDAYQQKDVNDETLSTFGFGDGGGGPTREMMEFARRLEDLPGVPRVRVGRVDGYFRRLSERVGDDPRLPLWDGELYFEYHRGTYTSQAQVKRDNRRAEFLLHNAELYATAAGALLGAAYPREALDECWEIVLRNQFHDIIPGSSIKEVYEDSGRDYARAFALGDGVFREALGALAGAAGRGDAGAEDGAVVVFNPTPFDRSDLVACDLPPETEALDEAGAPLPRQGGLLYARDVPANGYRRFALGRRGAAAAGAGDPADGGLTVTGRRIETPHLLVELNERGQLSRLLDKRHDREVLPPGRPANVLQAFEDKPLRFDAWDIDIYYQQKGRDVGDLVESVVEETGPERGVLRLVWRFEQSTITQRLTVYARTPRIDFETHVDWQQSQVLLKAAFPVLVRSTRATYEIQFGSVERPTHWNTSWDWARFETVAHKWADLSEGGYGVSLLNDCKYGHDVKDDVMRLTLIKSAVAPDPQADRGEHRFTYALYPHAGDWYDGGTVRQGYRLNNPLCAVRVPGGAPRPGPGGDLPGRFAFVTCTAPHVLVETVKAAESGEGLIVRVYEYGNRRGPAALRFCRPLAGAAEVNLLEEAPQPARVEGDTVHFDVRPFEIKTFHVRLT